MGFRFLEELRSCCARPTSKCNINLPSSNTYQHTYNQTLQQFFPPYSLRWPASHSSVFPGSSRRIAFLTHISGFFNANSDLRSCHPCITIHLAHMPITRHAWPLWWSPFFLHRGFQNPTSQPDTRHNFSYHNQVSTSSKPLLCQHIRPARTTQHYADVPNTSTRRHRNTTPFSTKHARKWSRPSLSCSRCYLYSYPKSTTEYCFIALIEWKKSEECKF
jgi:hypothetical protein